MICNCCGSITSDVNDFFFQSIGAECCLCNNLVILCDVCFEIHSFDVFHEMYECPSCIRNEKIEEILNE